MPTPQPFAEAWPALAERLRRLLAARGVPAQDRDDVVQETALRVYKSWPTLDPDRTPWPFVVTVGINIWRDVMRERTGRIAQVHPMPVIEVTADLDVERDVMARQELARVGVAMRDLAPEQRRLLLASEEFADTVRPLRPAERVARMRVRRQLARTVGRASAAVAVLLLRRPGRSSGVVATAYAGALAATVLTSPAMVTLPSVRALPPAHHLLEQDHHALRAGHAARASQQNVHRARPVVAAQSRRAEQVAQPAHRQHLSADKTPVRAKVCPPVQLPVDALGVILGVGSTGIYSRDDSGDQQPVVATPPVEVGSSGGCTSVNH